MSAFSEIAEEEFSFLVRDYGFSIAERSDRYVRFEKGNIFVQCTYDLGRSFEVGMQVGKIRKNKRQEEVFYFETILRMYGVSDRIDYKAIDLRSLDDVRNVLKKISRISMEEMSSIFNCDEREFDKLEKYQDFECEQYAKSRERVREFRLQAELAWRNKDYKKVLYIYSQIRKEELADFEMERIKFAEDNI